MGDRRPEAAITAGENPAEYEGIIQSTDGYGAPHLKAHLKDEDIIAVD